MKILGLDLSTNSGYSILEDGQIKNYGMINIPTDMNLLQRLSYFENNLSRILKDSNPDYVAIEDVILGISGFSVALYLGRISGVALNCCYKQVHNNITLYTPPQWKANSFEGLNGTAKKYEVQVAVCKYFNLIENNELSEILNPLNNIVDQTDIIKKSLDQITNDTKKYIAYLNRKRNGCKNDQEKKAFRHKIDENKIIIQKLKDKIKLQQKNKDNIYKSISTEINSRIGLTTDICDSIGAAMCLYKEIKYGK